jgi:hypothetical protein
MRFSLSVAAIGLTLAACSSSDSNAPGNAAPLTQADAQVIGDEMQSELAGMSAGGSLPELMSCHFGFFPGAIRFFHGPIHFGNPPAGCPTVTPDPLVDTDGDGIPDIMTLTFDPATCTFTRPGGQRSVTRLQGTQAGVRRAAAEGDIRELELLPAEGQRPVAAYLGRRRLSGR